MKIGLSFKWLMGLGPLAVAALLGVTGFHSSSPTQMGKVVRGNISQKVSVSGVIAPNRSSMLSAPYSGYVKKLYVDVGSQVKEGDPIISLTQSAKAHLEKVFPLRAPFAGVVVQVLHFEGEYVESASSGSEGSGLVRIDDLSQLFVEVDVPEKDVVELQVGQSAVLKAAAIRDQIYHGKIESIFLAAKEPTSKNQFKVEFPMNIEVLDPDVRLRPGMSIEADVLVQEKKDVLLLNHDYIKERQGAHVVVLSSGKMIPIEVGVKEGERVEVLSGLKEGDVVKPHDVR